MNCKKRSIKILIIQTAVSIIIKHYDQYNDSIMTLINFSILTKKEKKSTLNNKYLNIMSRAKMGSCDRKHKD